MCPTLVPFLASSRDAKCEKHKVPSQHMQVRGLGAHTFWGPCRAVPLCSLLCGLGRMVGGNVQMGPCSPSSASPSLQRRMKSQESPEGQDSGGSQAPPPHYFLRHPHGPKCWVGPLLRLQEPGGHKGPQKPAPKFLPWSRDPLACHSPELKPCTTSRPTCPSPRSWTPRRAPRTSSACSGQ